MSASMAMQMAFIFACCLKIRVDISSGVMVAPRASRKRNPRQHGGAIAQILGLVFVIAFSLGVFGPNLDRIAFSNNPTPPDLAGEIALFEAQARAKCNTQPTDNRGWILTKDGAIVCTDKRGRVRSQVTTLVRAAP
jgi:hypothetical protein